MRVINIRISMQILPTTFLFRVHEDGFGFKRAMHHRGGVENGRDFGNVTGNSYVYVGGLPSWFSTKLSNLALPSVVFEPRFRGAVRNVVYADEGSGGRPRRQEVMAYKVGRPRRLQLRSKLRNRWPCSHCRQV